MIRMNRLTMCFISKSVLEGVEVEFREGAGVLLSRAAGRRRKME